MDFPPKGVGEKPKGDGKFVPWGKHIPRKTSVNYYVSTVSSDRERRCLQ